MSRRIEVEYEVKVYALVDLDEGKVIKVVNDMDGIRATGNTASVFGEDFEPTEAEMDRAREIAEGDAPWPAWDEGY